jgi:hypothetical protein
VSAGLQLGLGLLMGVLGIRLMLQQPWIGFGALVASAGLSRFPRLPAAPIILVAAAFVGWAGSGANLDAPAFAPSLPQGHHPDVE